MTSTDSTARYGEFRVLNLKDIDMAAETLCNAFGQDTLSTYLVSHISNPIAIAKCHIELFRAYLHQHISHGMVIGTGQSQDAFETVAIWSTPESEERGLYDFAAMTEAGYGRVWDLFGDGGRDKLFKGLIPTLHDSAKRILSNDSRFVNKRAYTLVYAGSTVQAQGKGNLRKMFNFMFDKFIDTCTDTICYLESSSTSNIPIYNKFGFSTVEDIVLGDKSAPSAVSGRDYAVVTVMVRGNRGVPFTRIDCVD